MLDFITFSLEIYLNYLFLYIYCFLLGRSFVISVNKFYFKLSKVDELILYTKSSIVVPIIGLIVLGNYLIIINYFLPLNNIIVYAVGIILLSFNLFAFNKSFNISSFLNIDNLIYLVFIPGILLISSSDINFHYDAAYYHLNHQNWLRESNLIIGMTNIFWPFGMSSIYEYISSVLWTKNSLINLHYHSLIYFHFFYSFLYFHLFRSKQKYLKNGAILLLMFSILDNFGFGGGRNGFFYIQEVGKQDMAVAILFVFTSAVVVNFLFEKNINKVSLIYLSLISFFIFQLKVSGVFVFYIYFSLLLYIILNNSLQIREIIYTQIPVFIFALFWFTKSILTSGCIIYPLSFTCVNSFEWYVSGSTEKVETYTTSTSFAYMEYFVDKSLNFIDWFNDFFKSEQYAVFSEYYSNFYSNFLISFLLIYILKKLLFKKNNVEVWLYFVVMSFGIFSILYLLFFGPIPRYSTGILTTIIFLFGFFNLESKAKIPTFLLAGMFVISISLLPRLNSYKNFISNAEYSLFYPVELNQDQFNVMNLNWHKPYEGDRCWVDLSCTNEELKPKISNQGFFKVVKKSNNEI